MTGREQLSQSYKGSPEISLKKEQYNNKLFYLVIQSPDSRKICNYELKIESAEFVLFNRNSKKRKNNFSYSKKRFRLSIIHNDYAEICFKGSENIQIFFSFFTKS